MVAMARALPLCTLLLVASSMMLSSPAFAQVRPVFDYPADGQKLDYKKSFAFKVKPIANAKGYSWTISQNGVVVVSERITDYQSFDIRPGTPEHSKLVPGRIQVRVRALVDLKWTDPTIITISAVGQQPVRAAQLTASAPAAAKKFRWLLLLLPLPLLAYFIVRHKRLAASERTEGLKDVRGMELLLQPRRRGFFAKYELTPKDQAAIRKSYLSQEVVWSDELRDYRQRVRWRLLTLSLAIPLGVAGGGAVGWYILPDLLPNSYPSLFWSLVEGLLMAISPFVGIVVVWEPLWRFFYHQRREAILVKDLLTGRTVRGRDLTDKEYCIREWAAKISNDLAGMKSRGGARAPERIRL